MVPGSRRRFAVMFTDIVGFTTIMEKSEAEALSALDRHRRALEGAIARNGGILIKEIGDGTLSIYDSPGGAMRSARLVQRSLTGLPFKVRIGIHWGDVLVGDGDVLGDTVNVASRIEALSPPGGVCVSAELLERCGGRRPSALPLGMRKLRGLGRLIEIFALRGDSRCPLPVSVEADGETVGPGLPEGHPSILVATLANAGPKEDDFYSFGLTADLISDISRAGAIRVVPMTTMLQSLASEGSPEEAAARTATRYLLKGSLLSLGGSFQVSVELYDTAAGTLVWMDSWEDSREELNSLKGKLADGILKALGVQPGSFPGITSAVGSTSTAYEKYLRARYRWRTRRSPADTEAVRRLLGEVIEADPDFTGARLLLGETYRDTGLPEEGVRIFEEALAKAVEAGNEAGELHCRNALAISMWHVSRTPEARAAFARVVRMARRIGDREGEAKALNNIGLMDCNLARYVRALASLEKSLEISKELGYRENEANALCNIGLVKLRTGRESEARTRFEESYELMTQLGHVHGQANLLRNLGVILSRTGAFDEALATAERSIALSRSVDDRAGECRAMIGAGNVLCETGRFDEAHERYSQALVTLGDLGDRDLEGIILTNIAVLKMETGDYRDILPLLEKALRIAGESGDDEGETEILSLVWHPLVRLGRRDEAIASCRRGLELSSRIGVARFRPGTRLGIARALISRGSSQADREEALAQLSAAVREVPRYGRDRARVLWGLCLAFADLASISPAGAERDRLALTASGLLARAGRSLDHSAGRIGDPNARKSFLENIRDHSEIFEARASLRGRSRSPDAVLAVLLDFSRRSGTLSR